MGEMEIVIGQINVKLGLVNKNLETAKEVFEMVYTLENNTNHSLVVLPELFTTGYEFNVIKETASEIPGGKVYEQISKMVQEYGLWFYGSIPEKDGKKLYNTGILLNSKGELVAKYRKIHLFGPLGEKNVFDHGTTLSVAETPVGKMGLAICFDLRFPEQFGQMLKEDPVGFIISAEWPLSRIDHWKTLLRARAIENQVFVIGVNRVGTDISTEYGGNSAVYGPTGETIVQLGQDVNIIRGKINTKKIKETKMLFDIRKEKINFYDTIKFER